MISKHWGGEVVPSIVHGILAAVRKANGRLTPQQLSKRLGSTPKVERMILSLIDRGILQITLDWKVKMKEANDLEGPDVEQMKKNIRKYLAKIGAKGGKKSKRTLTANQARAMVKAREAKRDKSK